MFTLPAAELFIAFGAGLALALVAAVLLRAKMKKVFLVVCNGMLAVLTLYLLGAFGLPVPELNTVNAACLGAAGFPALVVILILFTFF